MEVEFAALFLFSVSKNLKSSGTRHRFGDLWSFWEMFFCRNRRLWFSALQLLPRGVDWGDWNASLGGIHVEGTLPGGDALRNESGMMEKHPKIPVETV